MPKKGHALICSDDPSQKIKNAVKINKNHQI
jgi:hypothetical protein